MDHMLSDGTIVRVDGNLDPSMPLVVLLHGIDATSIDMTAPLVSRSYIAFDRSATFPPYTHERFSFFPAPLLPVAGFFIDPPLTAVTSWRDALVAAGFSTVLYTQVASTGLIGPNVTQLATLATELLTTNTDYNRLRVAIVAHSRGGLIARSFLVRAAATPGLAGLMTRMTALITLHSPHLGTGLASAGVAIDALAARIQTAWAMFGLPPLGILAMLRAWLASPPLSEMAPGSAVLAGIAAGEPVPGVAYHTFGGTSTQALRLWANIYAPTSQVPLPVPFPQFAWGTTPVPVGAPLDVASFFNAAAVFPVPPVLELMTALSAIALTTPEIAPGAGDILVSNASAHLPFSATSTANPLNHAEALWDPTLQAQVIGLLSGLRLPVPPPEPAPNQTEVPDVVESTQAGADAAIRAADLKPQFKGFGTWVQHQAPGAGTSVVRGSTVVCGLGHGPRP